MHIPFTFFFLSVTLCKICVGRGVGCIDSTTTFKDTETVKVKVVHMSTIIMQRLTLIMPNKIPMLRFQLAGLMLRLTVLLAFFYAIKNCSAKSAGRRELVLGFEHPAKNSHLRTISTALKHN